LATGLVASILLLFVISFFNDIVSGEIFFNDAIPHYRHILALTPQDFAPIQNEVDEQEEAEQDDINIWDVAAPAVGVVGLFDVEIEMDISTNYDSAQILHESLTPRTLTPMNIDDLRNPAFLRDAMYIVDPRTLFLPEMFDIDRMISADLRVNPENLGGDAPVVLIFHTHTTELFVDSNPYDMYTGIVGVGAYLTNLLNAKGIPTMHYTRRFDIVDGQSHILGAYERQESYIRQILQDNPTIEVIIDLHRDGLPATAPPLVTQIDGSRTARLMFVNGLSLRNVNGVATPINNLPNPNLPYNLAFSMQMQMELNQNHPDLNRRIYLNAFRYSLHFLPKTLFVEVGDQRNTLREAKNAMYPLVNALVEVLK